MSTYVIGDIQGCFKTLRLLLARIGFDRRSDRLWLTGDIVNRGPLSLDALRWAKEMGDHLVTVLGNHDLHLMAVAAGVRQPRPNDTVDEILAAPDGAELIDWLRRRPLLFRQNGRVLVHAGILPQWSIDEALGYASEAETALGTEAWGEVLESLNSRPIDRWSGDLRGVERINAILQILTRMRTCRIDCGLCLEFAGPPPEAPRGCRPWFEVPNRRHAEHVIFFGHWAALGFYVGNGVRCLESGCVWGGPMTAWRLEDGQITQQPCADGMQAGREF